MNTYVARLGLATSIVLVSHGFITAQGGGGIPSAVLSATNGGPLEFAMALANAGVPAGLEIHEPDDVLPAGWPTLNGKPPIWFNADRTTRVSPAEVVDAFNRSHRNYRAVFVGRVLVVRPSDGTLPFLDQPSPIGSPIHVTGAMAAARRVFAAVAPGLLGPVLGSGIGRLDADISVTLDGAAGSVIDNLNQIAREAPPRAWVVTTRRRGKDVQLIRFGFIEADGSRASQGVSAR